MHVHPSDADSQAALPQTIDELGTRGCLYLAALLAAQERRLAIAPTHRMALAVLGKLRDLGVIQVPWPAAQWPLLPDAEVTPIEGLHWRYAWPIYLRERLVDALEEHLEQVPRDDYGLADRGDLWLELCAAEAEAFFAHQLTKHRFDSAWAQDFAFVHREAKPPMSIAQWRYCAWAAVRNGASVAQKQAAPDPAAVREAVYGELRRRAARIRLGEWRGCAFPPFHAMPYSALSRAFTQHLAPLGMAFWTDPPNREDLPFNAVGRTVVRDVAAELGNVTVAAE